MSAPLADDVQTSLGAGLRLQRYNKKCKCASIANNIFKKDRSIYLIRGLALTQVRLNVRCEISDNEV